jgi:integrase
VSVERVPSGKWKVRWRDASSKGRSKSFDRKADAQEWESTVRRAKQTGRLDTLDAGRQTLAELAAEHMAAASSYLADKTRANYRQLWAAHVDARVLGQDGRDWTHSLASMPIAQIRARDVEAWKADRLNAGAGPQAVRKTMVLMQIIFDRGVRDESITSNPVKLVKKPSGKRQGSVTVIAPEAVERIRSKLDDTGAMMVSLLAYSGMRPGEARALRWEHIGTKSMRVEWGTNPDGSVKPTKTEQARTVRLVKPLASDLRAWRRAQGNPSDDALVFPRADGSAWTEDDWRNWHGRKFAPAVKAAGVKINRAYDLRHSAASLWLHEGINAVQVAAWLGHNVSETFKTYAHVIAEFDPAERIPAETVIADARKAMSQDTSRTHRRVKVGQSQSHGKPVKRRSRAKSAVAA